MPPKLGEYTITIEQTNIGHMVPDVIKNHFGKTVPVAVKRIIFNKPATIAIFSDGSKSVVKTQGMQIYEALGVEGEVTVDAKKQTVKHTGKK